jgi:hypothetical protein
MYDDRSLDVVVAVLDYGVPVKTSSQTRNLKLVIRRCNHLLRDPAGRDNNTAPAEGAQPQLPRR